MGTAATGRRLARLVPGHAPVAGARRAWSGNWSDWWRTPLPARLYVATVVAAAGAAAVAGLPALATSRGAVLTLALLAAGSAVNIELGRWLEGGQLERDRTHKGLSAWPFTAALLMPLGAAGWVAAVGYAHMRARGIRIPLWKWLLSWSAVTLGSVAATWTLQALGGGRLPASGSWRAVLAVVLAATAFLAAEAALFAGISRLNHAHDETHLRRALASADFYVTELVVLAGAATAAVLVRYSPWAILLTVPGYVQLQRAVVYRALREEARNDRKTGLLNSEAWRGESVRACEHARRRHRGVAVLLADLDRFKQVNDTYGHVVGDEVLAATAAVLSAAVRRNDLVGRFGGEEFCVLLDDADRAEALAVAERIRDQVQRLTFSVPELRTTISIGVVVTDPATPGDALPALVARADAKLYEAKRSGRNRVSA